MLVLVIVLAIYLLAWAFGKVKFEPRDLWVGIYWSVEEDILYRKMLMVYLCILPTLPIVVFTKWIGEEKWYE